VVECGGKIIGREINHEAELGRLTVEGENGPDFVARFEQTESYGFLNNA